MPGAACPRRRGRGRQRGPLPPWRTLRHAEPALLVEFAAGGAAGLAAGRLQHRAWRRQNHVVGRCAQQRGRQRGDGLDELPALFGLGDLGLSEHHQPFGAAARVARREHRHAPLADAGDIGHGGFEFLRVNVEAAADDDVLLAPGQKQLAGRHVAEVAGVQPGTVEQALIGRRVVQVALRAGRAAELHAPLRALGQLAPASAHHAHLVAGQRQAAGDDAQWLRIVGSRRCRHAIAGERGPIDAVDPRAAAHRRKSQADRTLGQAVHRRERLAFEAAGFEARREALQRVGAHRFGAIEGQPPARQVQPGEIGVAELGQAQLIGEVGRRRNRAAVPVDRLQPARRPGEKRQRRHQHQMKAQVQRAQAGADQAHVVVQRQPGDEGVGAADPGGAPHRAQVGQQVGMGQDHALGVAGAARGVLQERDVRCGKFHRRCRCIGQRQISHRADRLQGFDLRPQQVGQRLGAFDRHQHACLRIAHDAGDALEVVFKLRGSRRRVQRHRHRARDQRAEERGKELAPGRQHDGHLVAPVQPERAQARGQRGGITVQVGVAQVNGLVAVAVQRDQHPIRMPLQVPFEHRHQRLHGIRRIRLRRRVRNRGLLHAARVGGTPTGTRDEAQQVARRLGFGERGLAQRDAEIAVDARDQFDAGQTVQAVVALERVVQAQRGGEPRLRPQLVRHTAHRRQQARQQPFQVRRRRQPRMLDGAQIVLQRSRFVHRQWYSIGRPDRAPFQASRSLTLTNYFAI